MTTTRIPTTRHELARLVEALRAKLSQLVRAGDPKLVWVTGWGERTSMHASVFLETWNDVAVMGALLDDDQPITDSEEQLTAKHAAEVMDMAQETWRRVQRRSGVTTPPEPGTETRRGDPIWVPLLVGVALVVGISWFKR